MPRSSSAVPVGALLCLALAALAPRIAASAEPQRSLAALQDRVITDLAAGQPLVM